MSASSPLLQRLLAAQQAHALCSSALPFTTLSYASSLDGCLAAERGRPTALSCPEALAFTHRLRAEHSGILVGLGTVLSDNPSLSVRLCAGSSPVALILDAGLQLQPAGLRLLAAWREAREQGRSRGAPVVLHGPPPEAGLQQEQLAAWQLRRAALSAAGARLLQVPLLQAQAAQAAQEQAAQAQRSRCHLDLHAALQLLAAEPFCLQSIMVEGGAAVLASFAEQAEQQPALLQAVLITLAPLLLPGGLHMASGPASAASAASAARAASARLQLCLQASERCGADLLVLAAPAAAQALYSDSAASGGS